MLDILGVEQGAEQGEETDTKGGIKGKEARKSLVSAVIAGSHSLILHISTFHFSNALQVS